MADLLYVDVLERFTSEQFDYIFDFEGYIPDSTTVTSRTITATRLDGTVVTDSMIIGSSISSDQVTVTINTLTLESAYVIKVSVVASDTTPSVQTLLLNVTSSGVYR